MLERPFIKQYNHIINEFLFVLLIPNSNYFLTIKAIMKISCRDKVLGSDNLRPNSQMLLTMLLLLLVMKLKL